MNSSSYSPFRYPGGKYYARKFILPIIPDRVRYGEPFLGGGQIYFGKRPSETSWLNDLDKDLVLAYQAIKERPMDLVRALQDETVSKDRHNFYKSWNPDEPFQRAVRWYYLNRTSYSGIMTDSCCYLGFKEGISIPPSQWGNLIVNASIHLSHGDVYLTSLDFEEAIAQYDLDTFAFIDPPYYKAARNLYKHEFDTRDHERLARVLYNSRQKFRFLLTYDDCPEIRHLYKWATISPQTWRYSIKYEGTEDDQAEAKEIFIENYNLC